MLNMEQAGFKSSQEHMFAMCGLSLGITYFAAGTCKTKVNKLNNLLNKYIFVYILVPLFNLNIK